MDLSKLQGLGAFVPQALFKRDVPISYYPLKPAKTWADPDVPEHEAERAVDSVTTYIRKRTSAQFLELCSANDADKPFLTVLQCIVQADGRPVFEDIDQVKRLAEWMLIPLVRAVSEVNTFAAKKSQPRTSSGAASPSPSAEPSRKPRPRSRKKSGRSG